MQPLGQGTEYHKERYHPKEKPGQGCDGLKGQGSIRLVSSIRYAHAIFWTGPAFCRSNFAAQIDASHRLSGGFLAIAKKIKNWFGCTKGDISPYEAGDT